MADMRLEISEIFGPTFQGEGPSAGQRCGFVRLGRCNLRCVWCDADYTWAYDNAGNLGYTQMVYDPAVELTRMETGEIVAQIAAMRVPMVVLTGGEPLVQQKRLAPLVTALSDYRIEVETNGTIAPPPWLSRQVARFNVSPKLRNSGNGEERLNTVALAEFKATRKAAFKFVVQGAEDLGEVDAIAEVCGLEPGTIWLMPEGCQPGIVNDRMQAVADAALARGWNLTSRLQVQVWGDRRGV